jgi:O-antigen ligase
MIGLLIVWILALIIFFRPLICGEAYYLANLIFNIVIFFLIIVYLISTKIKKSFVFKKDIINFFLFAFVSVLFTSLLFSINKNRSLYYSFIVFSGICLFYLVSSLERRYSLILLKIFLLSTFLVVAYGIYQYFWGFKILREQIQFYHAEFLNLEDFRKRLFENRIFSTFVYAPALAGFLLVTIPITIGFLQAHLKRLKTIIFFCFLFLQIVALFLTFSKAGFLLFLVTLLVYACLVRRKIEMRIVVWSLIVFLLLFNILLVLGAKDFPTIEGFKSSYNYRLGHYRAALSLFKERPLLGFGLMTFGLSYPKVMRPQDKETQYVHNCYLQIMQELGILGIIALVGFFIFYFKSFIPRIILVSGRSHGKEIQVNKEMILCGGLLTGILAFCLHSIVDNDFYFAQILTSVFFLMGITISLGKKSFFQFSKKTINLIKFFFIILCILGIIYSYFCSLSYYYTKKAQAESNFEVKIKEYLAAIKSNPFNDALYYEVASTYEDKWRESNDGQYFKCAQNYYRQAIAYNKMLAFYRFSLGNLYFSSYARSKNNVLLSRAIEQLNKAVELYPTKTYYRFYLANMLRIAGERKKSIMQLKKAQELKKEKEAIK